MPQKSRPVVNLHLNDGGRSNITCPLPVYTFNRLLDLATAKLQMHRAARRLFFESGAEVKSVDELRNGMNVYVSSGEAFVKHRRVKRTPARVAKLPPPVKPTRQGEDGLKLLLHTKAAVRILCTEPSVVLSGRILDCCGGFDGPIAATLTEEGHNIYHTNDIQPSGYASSHDDATDAAFWCRKDIVVGLDWIVSKPPTRLALEIIPRAYEVAAVGVAMLMDVTLLQSGSEWLAEHPPALICLPHGNNLGNRRSAPVWFCWAKGNRKQNNVVVGKRTFLDAFEADTHTSGGHAALQRRGLLM